MGVFDLTTGIAKRQNDRQGGIRKVYVFKYEEYSRSQFLFDENRLTKFPPTTAYVYDMHSASFEETQTRGAGGEKYAQSLTFDVQGTQVSSELWKLAKRPIHVIVEDMQGYYRFLGFKNGVNALISDKTGASVSDMNGYSITMDADEDREAPFMSPAVFNNFTLIEGVTDPCLAGTILG